FWQGTAARRRGNGDSLVGWVERQRNPSRLHQSTGFASLNPSYASTKTEIDLQKRNATVAVIGAGDYIGAEIVKKFASEGFTVFAGPRNGETPAPRVKEVEAAGRNMA